MMTHPEDLLRQIRLGEDSLIEFKRVFTATDLLTKAVETASAPAIIAAAYAEASRRCDTAKTALRTLPPTPARDSLEALLDYVVRRRS